MLATLADPIDSTRRYREHVDASRPFSRCAQRTR